jgi:FAD/FMN-containing dehydrogenase
LIDPLDFHPIFTMFDFPTFQNAFKGDLVTPTDPDYAKAIMRWALNARRNADIVAFVKDPEDVSLAINYAKANKLPIAIRGGGHNPAGASSTERGLVIDLSRYLNGVRVDPEHKLAFVGGGAIWETVDKTTIEHELATVAGTVNHVCCSLHFTPKLHSYIIYI